MDLCDDIIFTKHVRFAENICLIPILNEKLWYRDYAEARIDYYIRDNARFCVRIKMIEDAISHVFDKQHRDTVYMQRFAC